MDDPRINVYLSRSGLGSRRSCEEYVRHGRVQVDGEVIHDLSRRIAADETVRVDGKIVKPSDRTVVFALNKPQRVLSSTTDPENRPLAIDIVRPMYSGRLFSIGRLDFMSTGLLLFTNDGDLAQRLMRPEYRIDREYTVETKHPIPDDLLEQMRRGVMIESVHYRAERCVRRSARRVSIVLTEGKNRELRTIFSFFRVPARRVHRTRYGPIRLGELPAGSVRKLNAGEITALQRAVEKGARHDGRRDRRTRR
jgi:23S rRNA pseudouridine2605 synthase